MSADPLIAIVDDDASARAAVVGLVRALGFAAAAFASGAEFLDSDLRPRIACLIADMRMPGMSGLALHRRLVAEGRAIPTMLVTAYPDETTRIDAAMAGVGCYLAKPIEPEELLDCIRSALRLGSGDAEP